MQSRKFNVLMDMQWGSCGKGKFAPYLAGQFGVHHLSCSHRPNAGHTVRIGDRSWVLKCLPSAVVLGKNSCYLSAGASFRADQLQYELDTHTPFFYAIHPRAMLVTDDMVANESFLGNIASTMQGAGEALIQKISRQVKGLDSSATAWLDLMATENTMLHEAAQGWELSIDHGWKYPHVTSRNCGVAAALDEMAMSPRRLGDVYGVLRPFPIRVGNLGANSSGSTPGHELDWGTILRVAGAPEEVIEQHIAKYEFTTVTKRMRRVFELSMPSMVRAVRANGVSHLIVNFAQYLDWELSGVKTSATIASLPRRTRDFVRALESACGVPVYALGTGAEHSEVILLS